MDLATATPVEIDTELHALYGRIANLRSQSDRVEREIYRIDSVEPDTYTSMLPQYSAEHREKLAKEVARLDKEVMDIQVYEVSPLQVEFLRRGGWTRYYLVDNVNGHVHKGQDCATCFPTTQYEWLVEQSGLSAKELVSLAGEQACTVCFPWAPIDDLKKKTQLESVPKKAARLERECKKAEREAKKAAKAIANPDGSPLEVFTGHYPERQVVRGGKVVKVHPAHDAYNTLETLHAARGWLTDYFYWNKGGAHPSYRSESLDDVAKAVAHKEGKDVETVLAEAKKRADRR